MADLSIDGFRIRRVSAEERRAQWEKDRADTVRRWFDGDVEAADAVFAELPYSSIPGWHDPDAVMEALEAAGLLKNGERE